MRTYLYDDGRAEHVLEFQPAHTTINRYRGLASAYGRYFYGLALPPPPMPPSEPLFDFMPGWFSESYGLPRGSMLGAGKDFKPVDAQQFVNLRRMLRKEEAATWQEAERFRRQELAFNKRWQEYEKERERWVANIMKPAKEQALSELKAIGQARAEAREMEADSDAAFNAAYVIAFLGSVAARWIGIALLIAFVLYLGSRP